MEVPSNGSRLVRFGVFEADLTGQRLHKRGLPLRVQEKPFQLLTLLLERAGEVVTREELRGKLWTGDTFVEFDEGVNAAAAKLRYALGDSADNPIFFETIRGKGYRWLGPVEWLKDKSSGVQAGGPLIAPSKWDSWVFSGAVVLLLVAILAGGVFYWHSRREKKLTERDTIVLADFANSTGDAVFDDTLREALATQLQQSPFLSIVPDQTVREMQRLMGQSPGEQLNAARAQELCLRAGSKAVVLGTVASLGSQYVLGMNVINCQTGDSLAREEVQAAKKEQVLKALDSAAARLRRTLGESLASIQKFDTPIERATTSSLEALRAYSLGRKALHMEDAAAPLPWLQQSISLDPRFAMAYASLAATYSNLGEYNLAVENSKKAYDLRQGVSERERLYIESHYFQFGARDLERARQVYEIYSEIYPRDYVPKHNRSDIYSQFGQHEKALATEREAHDIDPAIGIIYSSLLRAYLNLDLLPEAQSIAEEALSKKLDSAVMGGPLYLLAFLREDEAGMARQVSWAKNKPGSEDILLSYQSDTEGYHGRLFKARELSREAVISARHANERETAAAWQANAALREAEFGNWAQARREANGAISLFPGSDVRVLVALTLARTGDSARVPRLLGELTAAYPADTVLNSYWLPTVKAALELRRRNPSEAIELLRAAAPYELGMTTPTYQIATLYPIYLRGEAYAALRQPKEAATEFQKIIDHRGVIKNFPLGALALVQLGRAHALAGDRIGARGDYEKFFALWKDADPDIPILKQARAEYAKLK